MRHLVNALDEPTYPQTTFVWHHEKPTGHSALWGAVAAIGVIVIGLVLVLIADHPVQRASNPNPPATVATASNGSYDKLGQRVIAQGATTQPVINPETLVRSGGIRLQIKLTRECWYEGESDGVKIPGHTWPAGQSRNLGALHEIAIRSGCPGGIDYEVNGKETAPVNLSNNPKIEVVKFENEVAMR